MSNWIAKLFEPKYNPRDIVNFIRTEYAKDVRHMRDEGLIVSIINCHANRHYALLLGVVMLL